MLGTYYYHEIIRKTIIAFGTLFNEIYIRHQDENNNDISQIKVPLAYSPIQKFLAHLIPIQHIPIGTIGKSYALLFQQFTVT